MGLETIIFTLLGIPVSWLTALTYEKIKAFSEKIETIPLQGLFIKSFYKSLDRHKKDYAEGINKLKKSIKQKGKQEELIKIFRTNVENYYSLIFALQKETFQQTVARDIVSHFDVEDNFKEFMVLIVRDCLIDYQAVFLKDIKGDRQVAYPVRYLSSCVEKKMEKMRA